MPNRTTRRVDAFQKTMDWLSRGGLKVADRPGKRGEDKDDRVPCQACWEGKHEDCYSSATFDCLCSSKGHPPGPHPVPDPEEAP